MHSLRSLQPAPETVHQRLQSPCHPPHLPIGNRVRHVHTQGQYLNSEISATVVTNTLLYLYTSYEHKGHHLHPHTTQNVHVKLLNSLNDGNTVNQLQCQVIKDPEKKLRIQMYM